MIQSITRDERHGLLKDLLNTPTQMCHFHMVSILMRKLRKKHQSAVGEEIKIIAKTLKIAPKITSIAGCIAGLTPKFS